MCDSGPPGRAFRSAPSFPDPPRRDPGAVTRRPRVRFDGWIGSTAFRHTSDVWNVRGVSGGLRGATP